ncbi:MAG TPA: DJ-1/PfpI family protein [Solirubrobacterales bacterium]|jgi:transcriptional regulator GlxA family with amidase domain|nr:DJ-1/PfpI family protein [Solirubrobacterales bacterium]
MEIAILIYDQLAALDAVGPYEVMRNVPGWDVRFVAKQKGNVRTEDGTLGLVADYSLDEVREPDVVLVPGGMGSRPLMHDERLLGWLREVDRATKWTTSVCTGSLLLGAAGLLDGKRATGNWLVLEPLRQFGADPVGGRWVEDGKVITAAGVTAGIDMALHLVAVEAGPEVAQAVQLGLEYDPDPPFDCGSPEKAPAEIVELVRQVSAARDPLVGAGD